MKRIVIDSNLIFSALRGRESITRNRILNSQDLFFTPNFLIGEIFKHKESILKKSKASEEETLEFLLKILNRIHFINEENISTGNFIGAYRLCHDVDEKDTPFVALALELGYDLWTRDEELKNGLKKKGFVHFIEE
ncbi:MAG: nucleotide-binding protein, PIN domain-containing protein [Bacteroidetes bacterium SW_11_45_7]|nr:MAG: nucleotide-binding protein, PIN domain-containing protein [Bacteroidetes bacterium SW_11_45_7]